MELPANAPAKLPVVLERVYDQTIGLTNLTPDSIHVWAQNKTLSDAGRKQLEQLIDLKRQLANTETEIASVDSEVASVTQDEDRTRQNLSSLNGVSGQQQQVQTYAGQLARLESRIATLRDRHAALDKQKSQLQQQVNNAIEKLTF